MLMVKDDDELGKDKQEKVLKWLEAKWPKEKRCCEICEGQKWSLTQHITVPMIYSKGIRLGGTTYPQISLICNNCGNTKFFNAVVMGLEYV